MVCRTRHNAPPVAMGRALMLFVLLRKLHDVIPHAGVAVEQACEVLYRVLVLAIHNGPKQLDDVDLEIVQPINFFLGNASLLIPKFPVPDPHSRNPIHGSGAASSNRGDIRGDRVLLRVGTDLVVFQTIVGGLLLLDRYANVLRSHRLERVHPHLGFGLVRHLATRRVERVDAHEKVPQAARRGGAGRAKPKRLGGPEGRIHEYVVVVRGPSILTLPVLQRPQLLVLVHAGVEDVEQREHQVAHVPDGILVVLVRAEAGLDQNAHGVPRQLDHRRQVGVRGSGAGIQLTDQLHDPFVDVADEPARLQDEVVVAVPLLVAQVVPGQRAVPPDTHPVHEAERELEDVDLVGVVPQVLRALLLVDAHVAAEVLDDVLENSQDPVFRVAAHDRQELLLDPLVPGVQQHVRELEALGRLRPLPGFLPVEVEGVDDHGDRKLCELELRSDEEEHHRVAQVGIRSPVLREDILQAVPPLPNRKLVEHLDDRLVQYDGDFREVLLDEVVDRVEHAHVLLVALPFLLGYRVLALDFERSERSRRDR
mmetsp:Transcript_13161/g.32269  ORF Transcript_13161/g.32269 Transcript_13161/m.32269 type:complete len:537 (+) Transcript_13161:1942-3552(+)